ncbi:hypothetical protein Tco_0227765 [Tanacetum coccineum]
MLSSMVTYTSVYFDSEPWRFQWVSDDELEALEEAPQFPEQAPPSCDYVSGLEHPTSTRYMLCLRTNLHQLCTWSREVPEYFVTIDDEVIREDPEEDPAEYPANGGDNNNDDDDEEHDDEDDDEEEEHLALADSFTVPVINPTKAAPMEACIAEYAVALTPPLPLLSPITPLSSSLP